MNLDNHILQVLDMSSATRPVTIGDLARRFGASPSVVLIAARRLADDGLATPAMVDVRGVPTLRGLLPLAATQVAKKPAGKP